MSKSKSKPKLLVLSHISELAGGAEMSLLEVLDIWKRDYGQLKARYRRMKG